MAERRARMALNALQPMGNLELHRLVELQGAEDVWQAVRAMGEGSRWGRRAGIVDPHELERATGRCGARFVIPSDDEWPARLSDLANLRVGSDGGPPIGLWVRGVQELDEARPVVALVGARAATTYGTHVTTEMAADIAAMGALVVSGLAYGIDAAAHRGALLGGGRTIAFVAGGVDRPYPAAHEDLYQSIVSSGAVVSEVPPGSRPTKAGFLARNRLISALSDGVVVVEAAARSGAKNTAAWANELGRHVMAVPGPVTSSMSATPHRLIREGAATLVTSGMEVLSQLRPIDVQDELPLRGDDTRFDALPVALKEIREVFQPREELTAAEISARSGTDIMNCLAGADELSDMGWLEAAGPQLWRLPSRR